MGNAKEGDVRFPRRITNLANETATPGKQTSTQALPPSSVASPQGGIWGPYAAGLEKPNDLQTGNPYVDQGLGCDNEPRNGCFLSPEARQRVIDAYHGRIAAAHTSYVAALTQLGVEELLRKEPEQAEWLLDLMLDVIGMVASKVITRVFTALRGGQQLAEPTVDTGVLAAQLASQSDGAITEAIGSAIGAGKAAGKLALKSDPQASPAKTANLAYIDALKDRAALVFEQLRENVIAGLDDSLLLVLFESYRTSNGHTPSAYKAELVTKLARFQKSEIASVGIKQNLDWNPIAHGLDAAVQHDTRLYWVKTPMGVRLGLYRRAHQHIPEFHDLAPERSMALKAQYIEHDFRTNPYRFVHFVPTELVDTAVQIHTARWGSPPLERPAGYGEIAQMGDGL